QGGAARQGASEKRSAIHSFGRSVHDHDDMTARRPVTMPVWPGRAGPGSVSQHHPVILDGEIGYPLEEALPQQRNRQTLRNNCRIDTVRFEIADPHLV